MEKPLTSWKQIILIIVTGMIGAGGGISGSYYKSGVSDQKLISRIERLEEYKVDTKKFTKMESLVVDIAVRTCKSASRGTDPAFESNCERIRYDYYNSN